MALDIAFSFDTTGSMASVIREVRSKVAQLIHRLLADIPDGRIAVIAHGDYGDVYVTKRQDFATDPTVLSQFVAGVSNTSGGDFEECYELVLHEAADSLSWRPQGVANRVLILIGDAIPHPVDSPRNLHKLDWRAEAQRLSRDMGIRVYAVQANNNAIADSFWRELASITGGKHLSMTQIDSLLPTLLAICYHERGNDWLNNYEREVGSGVGTEVAVTFANLRSDPPTNVTTTKVKRPRHPVPVTKARTKRGRENREKLSCRHPANLIKNTNGSRWSPWKLAFTGVASPDVRNRPRVWQPMGRLGYSRRLPFAPRPQPGSIYQYELAVQPRPGAKRTVLFSAVRCHHGNRGRPELDAVLGPRNIRGRRVRWQLEKVLRRSMRVFVRRVMRQGPAGTNSSNRASTASFRRQLRRQFSYAWESGRPVKVEGVPVSFSSVKMGH